MVAYNFGAPAINFAPLGQLGQTYQRGIKQRHESEIAARREEALAGFGQNGDLAALGKTLLQAGDLEGGMSALRLAQAGQGTPWQREQAALEAQRHAETRADNQAERDRLAADRKRDDERQDRLQPYVGANEFNEPRHGLRDPVSGDIFWPDGTTTPGPKRGAVGPQSSLPAPEGENTMAQLGNPVPGSTAERGFVIPGSLEGFPHGTTRAASAEGFNAPAVAGVTNMPAVGSVEAQATLPAPNAAPLAPPAVAGPVAVAAPPAATPPVTATMINQGTSSIAPMSNAEMIAEARRIGVSPAQYRQARASAIQKEMEAKAGVGEKLNETQQKGTDYAGRMRGAENEFRPVTKDSIAIKDSMVGNVFGSSLPGTLMTSDKYQSADLAKKEWIAGLLRRDSAGAVTEQEFRYYNDVYFPKMGQSEAIIKQYERARDRALQGVERGLPPAEVEKLSRLAPVPPPGGTAGEIGRGETGPKPPQAPAPPRTTSTGVGWSLW